MLDAPLPKNDILLLKVRELNKSQKFLYPDEAATVTRPRLGNTNILTQQLEKGQIWLDFGTLHFPQVAEEH